MEIKKISYKEIKAKQLADIKAKAIVVDIYRNFSTPFTWAFVRLGISPNAITISSYFLCIFGAILLSVGKYFYLLAGIFFFILFRIFDDSDGEVARIQNKKSIEGLFFDRISHYIHNFLLGIGIGFGLYGLYGNNAYSIYIIIGLIFGFAFALEDSITEVIKSLIRSIIIKNKIKYSQKSKVFRENLDNHIQKKLHNIIYNGRSWEKSTIFSKLFGIYPFQGLIYGDRLMIVILAALIIIEYFVRKFIGLPHIYGHIIGPLLLYILIVLISKITWIVYFIYKMEKNRYITYLFKSISSKEIC